MYPVRMINLILDELFVSVSVLVHDEICESFCFGWIRPWVCDLVVISPIEDSIIVDVVFLEGASYLTDIDGLSETEGERE